MSATCPVPRPGAPKDKFISTVLGWPVESLDTLEGYAHQPSLPTVFYGSYGESFLPHILEEARAVVHTGLR